MDIARKSLVRLSAESEDKEHQVDAALAYIKYTTDMEQAESADGRFIDCFRGTNLRRTEIVSISQVWMLPTVSANPLIYYRTASCGLPKSSVAMPS